jgi:hypothetical protein
MQAGVLGGLIVLNEELQSQPEKAEFLATPITALVLVRTVGARSFPFLAIMQFILSVAVILPRQ